MMYILYNQNKTIKLKSINEIIVQGDENSHELFVAIDGLTPSDWNIFGQFTLPNGRTKIVEAASETIEKTIEGVTYTGRIIEITSAETLLEGVLRLSLTAFEVESEKTIVQLSVNLMVNEGVQGSDPVIITQDQYQNLINRIPSPDYFVKRGGDTMYGNLNMANHKITNLPTPLNNGDAANKSYVDIINSSTENKLNYDVIKSVIKVQTGDVLQFTFIGKNLKTGAAYSTSTNISLANDTTAGLMSRSDYQEIRNLRREVDALEGKPQRLLYTAGSTPTESEIRQFVIDSGYEEDNWTIVKVVVQATNHKWEYFANTQLWTDVGLDSTAQFTNTTLGVIKGSALDGKVYAETDGTGSVYGWDDLKQLVNSKYDKTGGTINGNARITGTLDLEKTLKINGNFDIGFDLENYDAFLRTDGKLQLYGGTGINFNAEDTLDITINGHSILTNDKIGESIVPLENGLVPSQYLPSYVDDVISFEKQITGNNAQTETQVLEEAIGAVLYQNSPKSTSSKYGKSILTNTDGTVSGIKVDAMETGKIYINLNNNQTYRWNPANSTIIEISKSISTNTSRSSGSTGTAYRSDFGVQNYNDIQTLFTNLGDHTSDDVIHVTAQDKTSWSGKQAALVSGTNIKTIGNQSILGAGNIGFKTVGGESLIGSGDIPVPGAGTHLYEYMINITIDGNQRIYFHHITTNGSLANLADIINDIGTSGIVATGTFVVNNERCTVTKASLELGKLRIDGFTSSGSFKYQSYDAPYSGSYTKITIF